MDNQQNHSQSMSLNDLNQNYTNLGISKDLEDKKSPTKIEKGPRIQDSSDEEHHNYGERGLKIPSSSDEDEQMSEKSQAISCNQSNGKKSHSPKRAKIFRSRRQPRRLSRLQSLPIARKWVQVTTSMKRPSPRRESPKRQSSFENSSESSFESSCGGNFKNQIISNLALIRAFRKGPYLQRLARKSSPIEDTNESFSDSLARYWHIATGNFRAQQKRLAKETISLLMRNNIGPSTHPSKVLELCENIHFETRNNKKLGENVLDFFRQMGYVYYHPWN